MHYLFGLTSEKIWVLMETSTRYNELLEIAKTYSDYSPSKYVILKDC